MNKDESIKKVQSILAQMNFSKDELFKEMTNPMKIKPFKKFHIISNLGLGFFISFVIYSLFLLITGHKAELPNLVILPFFFTSMFMGMLNLLHLKDFSFYDFKGLNIKRNFFQYIKYRYSVLEPNNSYNQKSKNKISLNIYKKISQHITQEELENILSYNLTYEDLGLKDFSLKSSEEHQIFEEAKSNHKKIMAEYTKNEEIKKINSLNTTTKKLAASLKENSKS